MNEKIIKVGICQGNTNGIAYELIIKAFGDARMYELCIPIIYGSSKVLAYHRKNLESQSLNVSNINKTEEAGVNRLNVFNITNEEIIVEFGKLTNESVKISDKALKKALEELKAKAIDVLITTPGTTDPIPLLEPATKNENKNLKILVNDSLRIALATNNIPFSKIISSLTVESLTEKIKILQSTLIRDFMITSPRIAVLSLNPHADIKGNHGKEEDEIIIPAIKAAAEESIFCIGPYSADDFFHSEAYLKFDAVLAMYYDQGMIAFQTLTQGEGVIFTANLPYIITAPNQNISLEKAGKNLTSPLSLRNALYLAIDIHRNRATDKEINKDPLKKLYLERGSDNEKLDLTKDEAQIEN
ncbi:MAG: 4-hydroxythreonine-4-phosphate dehydrogenase PdxA [Dysgonamonadaceae bacterium]|jgi:4-hydroxythreonine-4-phosphate dehydrogenase|nr:4-hydroxythreonine-4-phosphate dehydrogenase PdxA [Dysgonamonadaceae bacterium]